MNANNTQLIIPLKDILNVDKEKGFRLGYQGMVVVIRGHEEIFFEFGKQAHRDDCTITILRALDIMTSPQSSVLLTEGEKSSAQAAANENLLLEVARKESRAAGDDELPRNIYQSGQSNTCYPRLSYSFIALTTSYEQMRLQYYSMIPLRPYWISSRPSRSA